MSKTISLNIPENKILPDDFLQFTPEENYNSLIIGMENIIKAKNTADKNNLKDKKFRTLAVQAFRDLPEFEIIDLYSVQGHGQGDFQLKFKDFSVLVDAKIYSNNVNCKAREKIKQTGKIEGTMVAWERVLYSSAWLFL